MEVQILVNEKNIHTLTVRNEQLTEMVVARDAQIDGLSKLAAQLAGRVDALEARAQQPIRLAG